jgi:hypothetical protein
MKPKKYLCPLAISTYQTDFDRDMTNVAIFYQIQPKENLLTLISGSQLSDEDESC